MYHQKESGQPLQKKPLSKCTLQGAGVAFVWIALFLLSVKHPNPEWPRFWYVRPLLIVPFSGAMGGLFYYVMEHFRYMHHWKKIVANVVSILVYIIGVWMGTVLGLDGTLWN